MLVLTIIKHGFGGVIPKPDLKKMCGIMPARFQAPTGGDTRGGV